MDNLFFVERQKALYVHNARDALRGGCGGVRWGGEGGGWGHSDVNSISAHTKNLVAFTSFLMLLRSEACSITTLFLLDLLTAHPCI